MNEKKVVIRAGGAPAPEVPLSQAIKANGLIFCSGVVPIDPLTGKLVSGGIEAQAKQVLENIGAVLKEAGSSMDKVVKTTVFLVNQKDFQGMNAVYAKYFPIDPPARATVQAGLMIDALVEIEAIAIA